MAKKTYSHIGWHFADNIANIEDTESGVELASLKMQVFFHSCNFGVANYI